MSLQLNLYSANKETIAFNHRASSGRAGGPEGSSQKNNFRDHLKKIKISKKNSKKKNFKKNIKISKISKKKFQKLKKLKKLKN